MNDKRTLSHTLLTLVDVAVSEGNLTQATALAQEGLALARELNNEPVITSALYWTAVVHLFQGDVEQAEALLDESLTRARERGDKLRIGSALVTLGGIVLHHRDLMQAEAYILESLMLYTESDDKHRRAVALCLLGEIRRKQGDLIQAKALCTEGVLLAREGGSHFSIGYSLVSLAMVVAAEKRPEQAAHLFGTAEPWLNPLVDLDPFERADYESVVGGVRTELGEQAFATAWVKGRSVTPEQAITVLDQTILTAPSSAPSAKTSPLYPARLTTREVEVLRLVASGLTDAQVAAQLVISPRTVNTHLKAIYSKIEVSSRSAATRYAMEHQLV